MAVEASGAAGICELVLSNSRAHTCGTLTGAGPRAVGRGEIVLGKLHNLGEGRRFGLVAPQRSKRK